VDLTEPIKSNRWLQQDLAVYNSWDAYATALSEGPVRELLRESGNEPYFDRWFTRFVPVVMAMQKRGFGHLDREARFTYTRKIRGEMRVVEREFMARVTRFDRELAEADLEYAELHECKHVEHARKIREAEEWAAESPRRTATARVAKADAWLDAQLRKLDKGRESFRRKVKERRRKFFNMSKDLKEVVFDEWQLRPAPVTKTRKKRSLKQDALLYILDHFRVRDGEYREALHALCHRARLRTIWQRYLDFWVDTDGRVYPTIKCASAVTMRLAVDEPCLQQWPDEIRHLIVPAPGKCFVSGDYSQIEARIAVIESDDKLDLELFANFDAAAHEHPEVVQGCERCAKRALYDVHAASARDRMGITYDAWLAMPPKLRKLQRNDAKRFRYKLQYGGSDKEEVANSFCPCYRCVELVPQMLKQDQKARLAAGQRWLARHSAVTQWHDNLCNKVMRNGNRYTSRFGYTRKFHEPWPQVRTKVVNYPCQHGAAEVINRAMETLHWEYQAPLVFQQHDNLIIECELERADYWAGVLKRVMETPIPEYATERYPNGYVFPVELKVTGRDGRPNHWGAA
jgi:hypothetical protein